MERRSYKRVGAPEVRAAGDGVTLSGYAAVFRSYSQNLGGFVESIEPDAFAGVLEDDTLALYNHDSGYVLGSRENGTLLLSADAVGLRYDVALNLADQQHVSLAEKVKRGDVRGSSFAFMMPADGSGESWGMTAEGFPLRTLTRVAWLGDVGPVSRPAYKATSADGLSAALRSLAASTAVDVSELVAACGRDELRSYLPVSHTGEVPVEEIPVSHTAADLSSYRRRLELLQPVPFRV